MTINAEWSDDCCGKKDYDAPVLSISTRYWPAGGSALVFDTATPEQGLRKYNDGSGPSAKSHLIINFAEDGGLDGVLSEKEFKGQSIEEVCAQVEEWAQEQMNKAVAALKAAFGRNAT